MERGMVRKMKRTETSMGAFWLDDWSLSTLLYYVPVDWTQKGTRHVKLLTTWGLVMCGKEKKYYMGMCPCVHWQSDWYCKGQCLLDFNVRYRSQEWMREGNWVKMYISLVWRCLVMMSCLYVWMHVVTLLQQTLLIFLHDHSFSGQCARNVKYLLLIVYYL